MKSNYLNSLVLPFIFVSALAAAPALAQSNSTARKAAPESRVETKSEAETQEILKFSQDGNAALREIEAARLAIFGGKLKLAIEQVEQARTSIEKGQGEAGKFLAGAKMPGGTPGKPEMLPVDGQLMVMDDFVPADEKNTHVANANEHFKKGEHEEALKELSLGDVKVIYNRLWMPIMPSLKRLDQALKLMDEHRYYEANLALKAIGDNLTIETDSVTETTKNTSSEPGTAAHPD